MKYTSVFLFIFLVLSGLNANEKPNIILIFSDDWGWGDLSCHGHPYLKTPNIDRLAKEGADFSQFTVSSGVCSPSRTAVMTGQFPARFGIDGHFAWVNSNAKRNMPDWLDPNAVMLPGLLQKAGYATAHYGKWHLANDMIPDSPTPGEYGYDDYGAFNCSGKQMPVHEDVNRSITFIDKAVKDKKPFFINLWIHEPHTPHHVLPEYMDKYAHLPEKDQVYAAIIGHADDRVGQLLDHLDKLKLADNTLIVFSSDNGPARGRSDEKLVAYYDSATGEGYGLGGSMGITGGRRGYKASLMQGGIGVPFLVKWPGHVKPGRVDEKSIISAVDLLPTFCSVAGAKLPSDFHSDGIDISHVLKGVTLKTRDKALFWKAAGRGRKNSEHWANYAVIEGNWKYLYNNFTKERALYRFPSDVYEKNDLVEKQPEVVKAYHKKLEEWIETLPKRANPACFSSLRSVP